MLLRFTRTRTRPDFPNAFFWDNSLHSSIFIFYFTGPGIESRSYTNTSSLLTEYEIGLEVEARENAQASPDQRHLKFPVYIVRVEETSLNLLLVKLGG